MRVKWLVKEEPENYSYAQFLKDGSTVWAGVKNPVGTATVSAPAYPDPKDKTGKLVVVELSAGKALKRPVTLAEIKADKRFAQMPLVRISRLSVQPVTDEEWEMIETLSQH